MDVRGLGEFGLIERLRASVASTDARLIAGIGDDAAVWRSGDTCTVATTDTMVAGVHFLPNRVRWDDVGWKALATNISDIAAMGATPSFALVTLCLPPETPVAASDAVYAGLRECADTYGVSIAGGDVVSSPVFAITIALLGEAALDTRGEPLLLRRDAARAGDLVAVTGPLGGSAAGLRVLQDNDTSDHGCALVARHMRPRPRVDAGRAAIAAGIRCGIDISDGLVQDLGHVCRASGAAAEIVLERVPVDDDARARFPDDAPMLAVTGGEDYELVLIAPAPQLEALSATLTPPPAIIGRMMAGEPRVRVVDAHGNEVAFPEAGWDHFAHAPNA